MPVAVITGAGAGIGRATAREFARQGYDVGLIGRDPERLEAAAKEVRGAGVRACVAHADVADPAALDAAAEQVEKALGPIEVWVNNAAATLFAPLARTEAAEFKRGTEVTYLGTVHGTMAALKRMQLRDRGCIVNCGSSLGYRALPLQAAASGAKAAIRGFTDAVRAELLHDGSKIRIGMVHLPAINTPQFDWTLNRTGRRPRPMAPVYQPEVAARAIVFAGQNPRRDIWVGLPTVAALLADRLVPGLADRFVARAGYTGQLTVEREPLNAPSNLMQSVPGAFAAHGRFDAEVGERTPMLLTSRHRDALVALAGLAVVAGLRQFARRR